MEIQNTIKTIRSHIQNKEHHAAETLLNDALSHHKKNVRLLLLKIKLYKETERESEADDLLLKSAREFPNNFNIMMELARSHINNGDLKTAENTLQPWINKASPNPVAIKMAAILAEKNQDFVQAHIFWSQAIQTSQSPDQAINIINAISNTELPDEYYPELIASILDRWSDNSTILLTAAKILRQRVEIELARPLWERILKKEPTNPQLQSMFATSLMANGDHAGAIKAFGHCTADDIPPSIDTIKLAFYSGDTELLKELTGRLLNNPTTNDKKRGRAASILRKAGILDYALDIYRSLPDVSKHQSKAQFNINEIESMINTTSHDSANDFAKKTNIEFKQRMIDGSDTVVLFFNALNGMPDTLLTSLINQHDVSSISFCDLQRLLYLNGISVLADNYTDTLSAIRSMLPASTKKLLCIGGSAGGYAAIRYGLDLGADAVLGFGAPTNITERFTRNDGRGKAVVRRLVKHVPDKTIDLRELILSADKPPKITLWYGEDMPQDKMHAENLRGLDTVELNAVTGFDGHEIVQKLISEERLQSILSEFLSSR